MGSDIHVRLIKASNRERPPIFEVQLQGSVLQKIFIENNRAYDYKCIVGPV